MLLGMQTVLEKKIQNKNKHLQKREIHRSALLSGVCLYLTAVDDGLELQGGEQPTVDGLLRDGQGVRDIRWRDTRKCIGFHHYVRMGNPYRGCGRKRSERLFAA